MFILELDLTAKSLSSMLVDLCDIPEKFSFYIDDGRVTLNIACKDKNERILIKAKTQEYLRKRFSKKIRKKHNKSVIKQPNIVEIEEDFP